MKKIKESFIQIIEGNLYTYIRYYDVKTDKFKRIAVVGKSMWSWAGEKRASQSLKAGGKNIWSCSSKMIMWYRYRSNQ